MVYIKIISCIRLLLRCLVRIGSRTESKSPPRRPALLRRNSNISWPSEHFALECVVRTLCNPPLTGPRSEHSSISYNVSIKVSWYWHVAWPSKNIIALAAEVVLDIPETRLKGREVGRAVAIIIGRYRNIVGMSPRDRSRRKREDIPNCTKLVPHRSIGYERAGAVIASNCHVAYAASHTDALKTVDVSLDEPHTTRRTKHRQVFQSTLEVSTISISFGVRLRESSDST